jgi:hypothetical protein
VTAYGAMQPTEGATRSLRTPLCMQTRRISQVKRTAGAALEVRSHAHSGFDVPSLDYHYVRH